MNILVNHCWCSDSIWGGHYNCSVILSVDRIPEGKTYYDPVCEDWQNLIEDPTGYDAPKLKREVVEWLEKNIQNQKGDKSNRGWAIGTDKYNEKNSISYNIFFQRQKDALFFIKNWSIYKKPLNYYNYFKDIRKKFDHKTKTLKLVKSD